MFHLDEVSLHEYGKVLRDTPSKMLMSSIFKEKLLSCQGGWISAPLLCTNLLPVDASTLICHLLQEKDFDQAERYADLAMNADRYNPAALINKGNLVYVRQDYEKAAEFYKEALRNDSSCTEARYNLGNIHFHNAVESWIMQIDW